MFSVWDPAEKYTLPLKTLAYKIALLPFLCEDQADTKFTSEV